MSPSCIPKTVSPIVQNVNDTSLEIPLLSRLSYENLKDKFENLGPIGGGGEALVFKVRSKANGEFYALRIDSTMQKVGLEKRAKFFKRMVDSQDKNPHCAKIMTAFWLENKNYPFFGDHKKKGILALRDIPKGEFIRRDFSCDPEAYLYYHEMIVMELGEDDVEKSTKNIDTLFFNIQTVFLTYCFGIIGILPSDDKARNYVWVSIQNEKYNGKSLKDYNYWLYSFGENSVDLYIPRQKFIPKRVDFGAWDVIEDNNTREINWNKILERNSSMDIKKLIQSYLKPNVPDDEILDMGALLKQS